MGDGSKEFNNDRLRNSAKIIELTNPVAWILGYLVLHHVHHVHHGRGSFYRNSVAVAKDISCVAKKFIYLF